MTGAKDAKGAENSAGSLIESLTSCCAGETDSAQTPCKDAERSERHSTSKSAASSGQWSVAQKEVNSRRMLTLQGQTANVFLSDRGKGQATPGAVPEPRVDLGVMHD